MLERIGEASADAPVMAPSKLAISGQMDGHAMRSQDLDKATFGIVLAGGGGRGAYQIGCWKKLKELGLDRFSVISGTSVGALNAALIAAGDVPQAVRLWEDLEESKVVKTSAIRKWTV